MMESDRTANMPVIRNSWTTQGIVLTGLPVCANFAHTAMHIFLSVIRKFRTTAEDLLAVQYEAELEKTQALAGPDKKERL